MAQLAVVDTDVVVRLGAFERLLALRWRPTARVSDVVSVDVWPTSRPGDVDRVVRLGFAAQGAAGRGIATVGPRARSSDGRPALVVTYRSGAAVVVRFGPAARWGLFLVSARDPHGVAAAVRSAAGLPRKSSD